MSKKKPVKTKKTKKLSLKARQKKLEIMGATLEEAFHLIGHSIEAGTEAETPWHEILLAVIHLQNQQSNESGHTIHGIKLECRCKAKSHVLSVKDYVHHCYD